MTSRPHSLCPGAELPFKLRGNGTQQVLAPLGRRRRICQMAQIPRLIQQIIGVPKLRIERAGKQFGDRSSMRPFDPWTVHSDNSVNGLSRVSSVATDEWDRSEEAFRDGGKKFRGCGNE